MTVANDSPRSGADMSINELQYEVVGLKSGTLIRRLRLTKGHCSCSLQILKRKLFLIFFWPIKQSEQKRRFTKFTRNGKISKQGSVGRDRPRPRRSGGRPKTPSEDENDEVPKTQPETTGLKPVTGLSVLGLDRTFTTKLTVPGPPLDF